MKKTKKNSPIPFFGIIISLIVVVLIIGFFSFFPFGNLPVGKVGEYTVGPVNPPGDLEANPAPATISLNDTNIVFKATDSSYNLRFTVTDYAVIRKVYLCESPCTATNNWTQVGTFIGTTLGGNYLLGSQGVSANLVLERNKLNRGNNYLAFYSCSGVGLCHKGKWVHVPFTVQYDLPDLVVDSIIFGQPIGTNIPVTVVIKNIGVGTSFNTVTPLVAAYTIEFADLLQQTAITTSFTINQNLAANEFYEKTIIIPLGESLNVKVNASVDILNQKPESNENNNHKMETQTLTLSPPGQVGELSTVPPRPLTCSVKTACGAGETNILELTDPANAHVALPGNNYTQKVCCINGNGPITVGTGDAFASLSDPTDAHVELPKIYPPGVSDTSVQYTFNNLAKMGFASTVTLRCGIYYDQSCTTLGFDTCLISATDSINAHAGACGSANHPVNLCCALLNTTNLCFGKLDGFPCDQNKICRNGQCQ